MSKEKLEAVKAQFQNLLEKATEMEMEKEEFEYHTISFLGFFCLIKISLFFSPFNTFFRIVLKALEGMKDDRKCFRQISGILVEQNVAEAKPYLKSHLEGVRSQIGSHLFLTMCERLDVLFLP